MDDAAISRLSERERACLRLVLVRRGSKEIGRELGISAHMVDKYIKSALRTLGASTRFEAARMLAQAEGVDWVQRLDPQPPDLPVSGPAGAMPDSWSEPGARVRAAPALPIPTAERPTNDLTARQRLAWILGIAAAVAVLVAGLASGSMTLLQVVARMF